MERVETYDYIVRCTAAGGQVRAFAAATRDLVEKARSAHDTSPVATAALGRLLTAGAMMGAMMKGEEDILTLKIQGDGPIGGLTVTADSHGNVKGYANSPQVMLPPSSSGKLDVGGAVGSGTLSVIQDVGLKEPYVGQTALRSGEIAEDLTYYYAISEQIPSCVALGVLMNRDNTVRQSGGFIVQIMPGASEEVVAGLEARVTDLPPVTSMMDEGLLPEQILSRVLDGWGPEFAQAQPARFFCNCSKGRVEKALISIGGKELREIIDDAEPIEVNCHFCGRSYEFSVEELEGLLLKAGG